MTWQLLAMKIFVACTGVAMVVGMVRLIAKAHRTGEHRSALGTFRRHDQPRAFAINILMLSCLAGLGALFILLALML
jgi:hypothetical protein